MKGIEIDPPLSPGISPLGAKERRAPFGRYAKKGRLR